MSTNRPTSSQAHNDATKTQCVICVTEIGNQSSTTNNYRQMYKLCTKYLHSGIAKEIPDDCELAGTFSDKDQIQLCRKCLGSAKELEEVTQTLASLRKRVSDMVLIFNLEILHRRGKNTRNQEAGMKLIQVDVSKLPDNDFWSSPTFTITTDEIVSTEIQEHIDRVRCMDKGDIVERGANDLEIEDVEIELMTEDDQVSGSIEDPLRNVPCSSTGCILSSVEIQENATETSTTEIGVPVDISELDSILVVNRTETVGNNLNASRDANDSEIAAKDFVRGESMDLTANNDQHQHQRPNTTAEKNDNNLQNIISMPIVKLQRLRFQYKSNPNGQDVVIVNDERKSNTIPQFELILKREPDVSTEKMPEVLHRVKILSVPSTSTSVFSLSMLSSNSNSKTGCDSVDMQRIPKKNTSLKKNVELEGDSGQKDSYQNQKPKSKHSGDSDRRKSKKGGFPCTVCKKTFLQMSHLLIHRRQHQKTRSYNCSLCPQRFSAKNKLKIHQRVKHGGKIVKCSLCDREFSFTANLQRHLRTHTGEKPFKCDVCGKSFSHSGTLTNHMRTHTGEKPYKCTFCAKSFSQSSHVNAHIRIHTGEKPFKCDKCDYSAARFSQLTSHKIHKHSNKHSLKCRDCHKTFKTRKTVRQHYKHNHAKIEFTDECILPKNYQ